MEPIDNKDGKGCELDTDWDQKEDFHMLLVTVFLKKSVVSSSSCNKLWRLHFISLGLALYTQKYPG
jgi:hypothetical protein